MPDPDGDWLPPGQAPTQRFPIVGETAPAPGWNRERFRLEIGGLVESPETLSFDALTALPQSERSADIHCVTGWSKRSVRLRGIPLSEMLAKCRVQPRAAYVRFVAHSARAHDTSLPLADALADTWLVHEMDGQALDIEHGGPLRSVTPGRYFYKSLKWLERIELLEADQPGYWERESAYHNHADPWREQRFDDSRTAARDEVMRLREADDYAGFQGRVLIKARLGGWQPRNPDLSGLQLKYCSLRAAKLSGVCFRKANLSLCNCEGAELRDSRFEDSDLEGVSFAGADLRGARMHNVALSATRFYRDFAGGRRLAARVEGLEIINPGGLLEDQAAFLIAAGATIIERR
jgi:DMSO/TMAO reductase YedYZ molybdopterin-dependent catalytic subunit